MKRTLSDVQKLRFETLSSGARNFELDLHIDEIINLYVNENWSLERLGEKYNVRSGSISTRLQECDIPLRSHLESQRNRTDNRKRSGAWNHVTEIKEKYKLKKNYALLSREYGCDLGTIKTIVNSDEY